LDKYKQDFYDEDLDKVTFKSLLSSMGDHERSDSFLGLTVTEVIKLEKERF